MLRIKIFVDKKILNHLKIYLQVLKAYTELTRGVIMINVLTNSLNERFKYENCDLPHLSKNHFGKSQRTKPFYLLVVGYELTRTSTIGDKYS